MSIDTIGDFLTIIRNAIAISKRSVSAPYSKMREELARVMKEEGYIESFEKKQVDGFLMLDIRFRYLDGEAAIHEIKRISTPGCRRYRGCDKLTPIIGGLGISILTTNAGIMTDAKARVLSLGGEVICSIW